MNDKQSAPHEVKATSARVYGPGCLGCRSYDAAIMLSFAKESTIPARRIIDVFLNRADAEAVYRDLKRELGK